MPAPLVLLAVALGALTPSPNTIEPVSEPETTGVVDYTATPDDAGGAGWVMGPRRHW